MKILKDIRVIELGTYITGPAAALHLADLGADVIKVERPGSGDPFRAFKGGLYSPHYQTYNRNKRSIALDTRDPADRAVLHDLVASADVFIQNFRPGVAEKLGAGEAELRAINPGLIYCAISGFGTSGPSRDRPAYDTVAQAASGLPAPPDAAHQPARDRPRDRRRRDRPVCRAGLPRGAAGADEDRQGPPHRHLHAGGHGAFQPRQLHPLLLGRRGHGPAVAPGGLAKLHLRMRRREMDRDPHVLAREVLGGHAGRHGAGAAGDATRASPNGWSGSSTRTT
jgi:hypothetical protein